MKLVRFSLQRPITILVVVVSIVLLGTFAILRMPRDILPDLGIPIIYIAQPYGGMDPAQMEGYLTYYYEYHFLFIPGVERMESRNIQVGNLYPMVPLNSVVRNIQELGDVPLRTGTYPTVFLKDVATVEDGSDIQTGYALVNGRRAVYIPVTKRADASTLAVVDLVKKNLSRFQGVLPNDIHVS